MKKEKKNKFKYVDFYIYAFSSLTDRQNIYRINAHRSQKKSDLYSK